jgi:hypothetical protein
MEAGKMKHTTLTILWPLLLLGTVFAADEPVRMPSAVSSRTLPEGTLEYVIRNAVLRPDEDHTRYVENFKERTPNADEVLFDATNRGVIVRGNLSPEDLRKGVDIMAKAAKFMPYWEELLTRDMKSARFDPKLYQLVYVDSAPFRGERLEAPGLLRAVARKDGRVEFSLHNTIWTVDDRGKNDVIDYELAWHNEAPVVRQVSEKTSREWKHIKPPKTGPKRSVGLRFGLGSSGTARLNKHSCYCMALSRHALRVFDKSHQYVWEDTTHLFGHVFPLAPDLDQDGVDEVVIFEEEHGRVHLFVFRRQKRFEKSFRKNVGIAKQ